MLVDIQQVTKKFNSFVAVDDVSFQIAKGECLGLLGPNGAGKSTMISMIYGASIRTSGKLQVFQLDPAKDFRKIKKNLGVVTQEDALDESMSVWENMMMFAGIHQIPVNERTHRVNFLLKFMSIDHKKHAPIRSLSGGMRRRLVFVRALISDPELIILDEPTTGLDPAVRFLIWEKIQELKSKGHTVLLTTHYMDEAEILCDRLIIMNKGKVIAEGTPKNLIQEYCPGFVAVLKKSDLSLGFVENLSKDFKVSITKTLIQIRGPHLTELTSQFNENELVPDYIRPANLEDAFLQITGKELSSDA